MAALILVVVSGCDSNSSNNDSESDAKKEFVPNLSFHKPANLQNAVNRIASLHDELLGGGPLPEPTKYEYVEVMHGQGASGHSHYFLASEYDETSGHDDHHDDMDESIEHRTFEVGFRKELSDLARWLPDLAAASDLDESDWNSIKELSKKLQETIESIGADISDSKFREGWQSKKTQIDDLLNDLNEIAKDTGGALP